MKLLEVSDALLKQGNECPFSRMVFTGQSYQIFGAIVILNSVKVMDNKIFGERFIMILFPYISMFKDIAFIYSNIDISVSPRRFAPLPANAILPTSAHQISPAFEATDGNRKAGLSAYRATIGFLLRMFPFVFFLIFPLFLSPCVIHNVSITRNLGKRKALRGFHIKRQR